MTLSGTNVSDSSFQHRHCSPQQLPHTRFHIINRINTSQCQIKTKTTARVQIIVQDILGTGTFFSKCFQMLTQNHKDRNVVSLKLEITEKERKKKQNSFWLHSYPFVSFWEWWANSLEYLNEEEHFLCISCYIYSNSFSLCISFS